MQVTAYGRQTVPDRGLVWSCDPLKILGVPIISLEWLTETGTVRQRNDVATTLLIEVFTQRNFVADVIGKTAKSRFVPPFRGRRGNVHYSSMARWKSRSRLPISANLHFFH